MTHRHFKYEGWLYALAFFIAIGIRIIQLGALPLNDVEATSALQALQISQSEYTTLSPNPFYILSTSILFLMYGGGTDFLARFMPALIGSLLVFAPLLFDDRLKPRPSLLLAFFLALDPGLVAISRQAASPIFAITFLIFTFGFINKNKLTLASIFAALTLLSGSSIWLGLLGFIISGMIFQLFQRQSPISNLQSPIPNSQFTNYLIPFILTFLTAGTLFLTVPNGLSAAFASIPEFFKSFTSTSETTWGMILISFIIYQPLALILAIFAIVRGILNNIKRVIFLTLWMFVALLLVIFLPARQITDLVWVLIPLNVLASLELARAFNIYPEERSEVAGVTLLTVFIWVFAWLGFAGMTWYPADSQQYALRFWMLLGSLVLLALSLLLIAAGWSARTARIGGVWGFVIALGALMLGGTFGAAGLRGQNAPELWWQNQIPAQADLLHQTAEQVSEFYTGNDTSASIVILGIDSASLVWSLREFDVQIAAALDPTTSPDIVITRFENNPTLMAAYRGQDFNWRQTYLWHVSTFDVWVRWVTLREISYTGESIILWARDDLFVDK
ncbi:MAG: hypothetical protein JNK81_04495 [Anaerolineales bacterium]|nr:hypothetical protein [Anaerolineales bacterium]